MENTRLAMILALGLVLAALVHGGFYHVVSSGGSEVHLVNKFTGGVVFCVGYNQCASVRWK